MADTEATSVQAPGSPTLVSPREAAVVGGEEVTFVWRPVDTADEYYIEVASDAKFSNRVLEENVGDKTAVTVGDIFDTDERTYFWRVLAKNEAGWSPGEHVESFVSTTQEEADRHAAIAPNTTENLGPATELVRAASADVVAELGADDREQRFEREKEIGVADEGIPSGQIMAIAVSIMVSVAIAVIVLFQWTSVRSQTLRQEAVPSSYNELEATEIEAARQLESYDVVDEEAGVYRIPIDRAMDIMANEAYTGSERLYSPDSPLQPPIVDDQGSAPSPADAAANGNEE